MFVKVRDGMNDMNNTCVDATHRTNFLVLVFAEEDPCECNSLVKFQKKVEEALQALAKKYILCNFKLLFSSLQLSYRMLLNAVPCLMDTNIDSVWHGEAF